jgi:hypothetical protein
MDGIRWRQNDVIEPAEAGLDTLCLERFGEPGGNRTRDHLIKSQVLYRLSYRLVGAAEPSGRFPGGQRRISPLQRDFHRRRGLA